MDNMEGKISFEEALSILGASELDPIPFMKRGLNRLNDQNHNLLYPNLKFLILCHRIYLRYKSRDVRYFIMELCTKFISDIYRGKEYAEKKELIFILTFIFHFRNTPSLKALEKIESEVTFIKKIREQMISS